MTRSRVLVIGLDGLEVAFAEQLMAAGEMPALAELRRRAARFRLGHVSDCNVFMTVAEHITHAIGKKSAGHDHIAHPVSSEPLDRLASYATDGTNPSAARREADGVLRLFRQRRQDFGARMEARVLDPIPLGLLMLVPAARGGTPS